MAPERNDERYFERAAAELRNGDYRQGMWEKCLAESAGDRKRARDRYISQRVGELHQETRDNAVEAAKQVALDAEARRGRIRRERWQRVEGHELNRTDQRDRWLRFTLAGLALLACGVAAGRWLAG